MNTPSSQDLHDKLLRREQHLKELLHEAVGWLVEYECTGRFDDRGRKMLRDMIDRGDAAVGNPPNDWAEDDRLAQANANPTSKLPQTRPSGITPPPELLQQWREQAPRFRDGGIARENWLMTRAAQWGADQELKACCEFLEARHASFVSRDLRAARRPKPPSLKERLSKAIVDGDEKEALKLLEELDDSL